MNRSTIYSSFRYEMKAAALGGRASWQLALVVVAGREGLGPTQSYTEWLDSL